MTYKIDKHGKLGEFGRINDALLAAKELLNHPTPLIIVYEDDKIITPVAKVEIDYFLITMFNPKEEGK